MILVRVYARDVRISTEPVIPEEQAEALCRALLAYDSTKAKLHLQIEEDTIVDQRLIYRCYLTGPAEITDAQGNRATRDMMVEILVDAVTGDVIDAGGGDWSPRNIATPLTRPLRLRRRVVFRDEHIHLLRGPIVREQHALISKQLFEALGAKVTLQKDTGTLVLEKADDPLTDRVGSRDGTADGQAIQLPVAPEMLHDTPYLPASLVTHLLGMPVRWDAEHNCLYIDCKGEGNG